MSITPQIMKDVQLGNIDGVQRFLNSHPSKSDIQNMIYVAAGNGRAACVKMMLPVSLVAGSQIKHTNALKIAARKGHAQCVELLIPVSNPLSDSSAALCAAIESGDQSCIDMLFPVSDLQAALDKFQYEYSEEPELYETLEHMIAQRQKQVLSASVDVSSVSGSRKM